MMSSWCVERPDEGAVSFLVDVSWLGSGATRIGVQTFMRNADRQVKPTTAVDGADGEIGVMLAFLTLSMTGASVGDIPRGAMIRKTEWRRREVLVVRDFPPGFGPAWWRDRPLAAVKRVLFQEEPEADTSDAPDRV
ncbi:hypothetical protein L1987_20078 [Smallanthus sonchifolius]|uniref:Uncharacterized protein n=1 Tax=Smallanthus sonchifolius TaxID=185202 RepID=A0ACB9IR24_9ASTR|nr:hypothetical protein L1987_20078 [Smallanthus sonchifolius]